jgi:adenine-specific DNA-methyltransferase
VWWRTSHDAGTHGSTLLARLLGKRNVFSFPKSLYATRDCLEVIVKNRPDALIVDFFAGSGTTLHSTLLLNQDDGGSRRCILVTNNEVDPKVTAALNKRGIFRGDPEFEAEGIFEAATRPRVATAITGVRPGGEPVPTGKPYRYLNQREFSEGFEENVEFFRLDYLDPDTVELGRAFDAIHPALWLIAGGRASRPSDVRPSDAFYVAEHAGYAILFSDSSLRALERALENRPDVTHVFVVTDSEEAFVDARSTVGRGRKTSMIYRDYLGSFRINTSRQLQ